MVSRVPTPPCSPLKNRSTVSLHQNAVGDLLNWQLSPSRASPRQPCPSLPPLPSRWTKTTRTRSPRSSRQTSTGRNSSILLRNVSRYEIPVWKIRSRRVSGQKKAHLRGTSHARVKEVLPRRASYHFRAFTRVPCLLPRKKLLSLSSILSCLH